MQWALFGLLVLLFPCFGQQIAEQCVVSAERCDEQLRSAVVREGGWVSGELTIACSNSNNINNNNNNSSLSSSARGRGLVAFGPLQSGRSVLGVPGSLVLCPSLALRLRPSWRFLLLPDEPLVGLLVAVERFHGTAHRVRRTLYQLLTGHTLSLTAHLNCLPQHTVPNRAAWTAADLMLARALFPEAAAAFDTTAGELWRVHLHDTDFVKHIPVTAAQFRWAYSMALSRTFEGGFMVPFVDFANHPNKARGESAQLQVVQTAKTMQKAVDAGMLTWAVSRDVAAGEELLLDYGDKSSIMEEAAYGWTDEEYENPLDVLNVPSVVNASHVTPLTWQAVNGEKDEETVSPSLRADCAALLKTLPKWTRWPITFRKIKRMLRKCASANR